MDIGELSFPMTIEYGEDNIDLSSSYLIEQDKYIDMIFDDLITLWEDLYKKNKMFTKSNKNLETMHENLKMK